MKINRMGDNRTPAATESRDIMIAAELELDVDEETERVLLWREEELERVGYERATARKLAERTYVDLHLAMDLLRRGCPTDTAVRILV
ncbi:MAG TPA: hypothetical protein VGJ34_06165 [Gaiellaceae bacterium]